MSVIVNDLVQAQLAHRHPLIQADKSAKSRLLGQLVRMRFQIFGGMLTAVTIPVMVVRGPEALLSPETYLDPATVATVMAFLVGFYIFRKVASLPGITAMASIMPSFVGGYAATGLFYMMTRLRYSGAAFLLSCLGTIIFFYGIFFAVRRFKRLSFALVPEGRAKTLLRLDGIDWHCIEGPDADHDPRPVIADLHSGLSPEWVRFITNAVLTGRPVYHFKHAFESLTGRTQVDHISENEFGTLSPNALWASMKRYSDIVMALSAIILISWLLLLIAVAIRLESRGPAIFKQQRIGQGGRPFVIYKFRTMRVLTPEQEAGNRHYHDEDRITPLGALLRRTRLDELPQLLNILRGEMSWIGPRPEAISLANEYEAHLPFYHYRHVVRPGITGWAQVHQGHVVGTEAADLKMQYDFFYIKNFSLWLDILVVLKSFRVVLLGTGAR